ncbi:uncharacterized protein [Amphiura filiformis]|uniref:uncharacterized protein n=1 Tax=Amphiura filiformis TaxID=82378 RepID=UPI003B225046
MSEYELAPPPPSGQRVQPPRPPVSKPRHNRPSHQLPVGQSDTNPYSDHLPTKTIGIVQPQMVQSAKPSNEEEFPRELCHLSVGAVAETLHKLKIPDDVVGKFREAQIDGQIFVCLDDIILEQMGVDPLNKLKITKFKNGWRPNIT